MTDKKEKHTVDSKEEVKQNHMQSEDENINDHSETAKKETEAAESDTEALKAENAKLKDAFLRAYAEAENIKKRCQQEIEKNSKFAISSFAKELLTVADNLQRAISSVDEEHKDQYKGLLEGIIITQKELTHVFDKFGIKKIECLDTIFDPNFERVVQEIEDPTKPAGTIVNELQTGYTLNDRILREAMVIVTKGGK
ncbi:MAG: nucleotide exchange factor GrpE [Alphaproteobacteria bacterium]|nr:nucleotide exchange factor GrpE [Alphaproteobacteria bacterium]